MLLRWVQKYFLIMYVPFYFFLKMRSLNFEGGENCYNLLKFIFILFIGSQLNL